MSEDYAEIFQTLRDYFAAQVPEIGDDELLQEVDILDYLIAKGRVDEDLPVHVSE